MIQARAGLLVACAWGVTLATVAQGQAAITVGLPVDHDSVPAGPLITMATVGVPDESCPCVTTIEVATTNRFDVLLAADSRQGTTVSFTLPHLLPERTTIFILGRVNDRFGTQRAEQIVSGVTRSWLRLISPTAFNTPIFSRQPTFIWSSSSVTTPPGPWAYDITITNTASKQTEVSAVGLRDTSFVPATLLQANTSYQWSVHAYAATGDPADQVTVGSPTTFVISSADAPLATLLHQNFPNPFPNAVSATTCIWFDLAIKSRVRLTVYTIRGHQVRVLFNAEVPAGAYGRSSATSQSGCNAQLSWDGTDDRGHGVPSGVYILIFQSDADQVRQTIKIVFAGR